jgi:hypothetical protein
MLGRQYSVDIEALVHEPRCRRVAPPCRAGALRLHCTMVSVAYTSVKAALAIEQLVGLRADACKALRVTSIASPEWWTRFRGYPLGGNLMYQRIGRSITSGIEHHPTFNGPP